MKKNIKTTKNKYTITQIKKSRTTDKNKITKYKQSKHIITVKE